MHRLKVRLPTAEKVPIRPSAENLPNNQMNIYGSFPSVRMRRMRRDEFSRRLMRETVLTTDDLFIPSLSRKEKPHRQSGFNAGRRTHERRPAAAGGRALHEAAHSAVALFPVIDQKLKTLDGREAFNPKGLIRVPSAR